MESLEESRTESTCFAPRFSGERITAHSQLTRKRTVVEEHEFHQLHSPANRTPRALRASSSNRAIPIDIACVITGLSFRPSRISPQKCSVS